MINPECTMIVDDKCDNDRPNNIDDRIWTTCKGKGKHSIYQSCVWIKGN